MARQIQIRRGTATENDVFTGAIGEITMDITNNTLRVHDGETVGGTVLAKQRDLDVADYVIATQLPTVENGYTWYRKYKSGWVEQGGIIPAGQSSNNTTINLPMAFSNKKYIAFVTSDSTRTSADGYNYVHSQTKTTFQVIAATASGEFAIRWYACGM